MSSKTITVRENEIDLTNMNSLMNFADQVKEIVVKGKLYSSIQGRNYVNVEGWQLAGALVGYFPILTKLEKLTDDDTIKYRAEVDLIRNKDGQLVGRGVAICSKSEYSKRNFDEYAIASMAQTRATGKAFRLAIGWLLKLAGYEATPSEEMEDLAEKQAEDAENKRRAEGSISQAVADLKTADSMARLESVWVHLPQYLKTCEEVLAAKNAAKIQLSMKAED